MKEVKEEDSNEYTLPEAMQPFSHRIVSTTLRHVEFKIPYREMEHIIDDPTHPFWHPDIVEMRLNNSAMLPHLYIKLWKGMHNEMRLMREGNGWNGYMKYKQEKNNNYKAD